MAKARYFTGRLIDRTNAVTSAAKQEGLEERIYAVAETVAQEIKSEIRAADPIDQKDADMLTTYYDAVKVADGGKDYRRATFPKGTRIRVAIVTTAGGAFSAEMAEYGTRGRPGLFPMTKAVFKLGGRLSS